MSTSSVNHTKSKRLCEWSEILVWRHSKAVRRMTDSVVHDSTWHSRHGNWWHLETKWQTHKRSTATLPAYIHSQRLPELLLSETIQDWNRLPARITDSQTIDWLCWGLTTRQPLWVILCRLPEKGRKEIEEIVEEMKETIREEIGTGIKVKKQKK